jgi:proteasome lid subunit RPN8/RPN11
MFLLRPPFRRDHILLPPSVFRPPRSERDKLRDKAVEIVLPTDLMFSAFRQLFPAERMLIMGGRQTRRGIRITSVADVSEPNPSAVHVRADKFRLNTALVDLSRTGAHFAVWVHSHPGLGPGATHPSDIDIPQEQDLRRHYSGHLLGLIVVRDGVVRAWGQAIDEDGIAITWRGSGIAPYPGERHVYQLALR